MRVVPGLLVAVLVAATACGTITKPPPATSVPPPPPATSVPAAAPPATSVPAPPPSAPSPPAACVSAFGPDASRETLERAARDRSSEETRVAALVALGRWYASAPAKSRDYRAALASFERVLADHPRSAGAAEARAWRVTIAELLAREEESARLRKQLERLRQIDLELDRRR